MQKELNDPIGRTVKQLLLVLTTLPSPAMLLSIQLDFVYGSLFPWMSSIFMPSIVESTIMHSKQGKKLNTLQVYFIPMTQLKPEKNFD
jgi:hypothetical protein